MQGMGRKAELCLSKPCHVCGTEAKTEYSGERSTCDATTADGAQEQRNGNVWVPQIFLSVSLGVLVVEGGQESDDDSLGGAWGNSSKDLSLLLTCCCHLCSLSFTLHSLRDSEGTAQQPWAWGGTYRKSWHSQKARRDRVLAQEGTAGRGKGVNGTSCSSPSLPGGTLCPPALGKSLPALLPPILFQDCQSSGSQAVGSSTCQTWAVLPSPSDTQRHFGEGFDMIKHLPFLKLLLAVCFCDDLQFPPWPLGIWHSSRAVTANISMVLWVSSTGNFPATAASCACHEGLKWLTSKSHYAVATVITT